MAKHTIYIREADEDKWKDIPNKSEWVHKKLNEDSSDTINIKGENE